MAYRAPKLCRCGSGEYDYDLVDAAGIFCAYVCESCEAEVRKIHRLSNSQRRADERWRTYRGACRCGSGEYYYDLVDAAGIFCAYVCESCEAEVRSKYNPAIFFVAGGFWGDQ